MLWKVGNCAVYLVTVYLFFFKCLVLLVNSIKISYRAPDKQFLFCLNILKFRLRGVHDTVIELFFECTATLIYDYSIGMVIYIRILLYGVFKSDQAPSKCCGYVRSYTVVFNTSASCLMRSLTLWCPILCGV